MSSSDTNARLGLPSDQEMSEALTPKLPAWCALSGWHFVTAWGVAFFFAYHSYLHLFYSDLWGHVSYGEWILQHETLPTEDPFVPLAAGVPVIATAWGGQVLLAWVVRLVPHLGTVVSWNRGFGYSSQTSMLGSRRKSMLGKAAKVKLSEKPIACCRS